jgi:hypothetical protein
MAALTRWCALAATLALVVCALSATTEEVEVLEAHSDLEVPVESGAKQGAFIPGQISLAELREQTMDKIRGQTALSLEDMASAKSMFMSMMQNIKTGHIKGEALIVTGIADDVFHRQGEKTGGSGLDVIFVKLKELEDEITDLQKSEGDRMNAFNAEMDAEIKAQEDVINDTNKLRTDLRTFTDRANGRIADKNREWVASRATEDNEHKSLVDLQTAREESILATKAMVDERNKAIDVMQTALFLVCERFKKFKNGPVCLKVKSQPDVAEPKRFETNPPAEAQELNKEFHDPSTDAGAQWNNIWDATVENDKALENSPNPEGGEIFEQMGGDDYENQTDTTADMPSPTPAPQLGASMDDTEEGKDKHEMTLAEVIAEEDDDIGQWKLTKKEQHAQASLSKLAESEMPDRYKLPMVELAESIKVGSMKRSRSIVGILMDVMHLTKTDLAKIKSDHTAALEADYASSWNTKGLLNTERENQDADRKIMEDSRLLILHYNIQGETNRVNQILAIKAKFEAEDIKNKENEAYGIEEAWRIEDMGNIQKLKSILRMLYYQKKPQCGPNEHNPSTKVLCSGMDRGWCIFTELYPIKTAACSCNPGYYGPACEYVMCPGIAKNLYEHDAPGVCSNTEKEPDRGTCDKHTGLCTCNNPNDAGGYYHGPKRACDYKNAPMSKNGLVDNKCSERGAVVVADVSVKNLAGEAQQTIEGYMHSYPDGYDKPRGYCNCKNPFYGPACEYKKCPNTNGNLYPATSANACNGHGACSPETGLCTCRMPYHCGQSCGTGAGDDQNSNAAECSEGNGEDADATAGASSVACDMAGHGKCVTTCTAGTSCGFEDCPEDCRVSSRTACDTQTGACSCLPGTSGHACEFFDCPGSDPGSNLCGSGGQCNRCDGKCICHKGFSGIRCDKTQRCTGKLDTPYVNWWTIWNKPGWITCPVGQLLYRLSRGVCDALSCINTGGCAAGCEGTEHVFQIRHCYHDLNWYNSFDVPGWSKCLDDYFIAGLYRSGESLYELQMAKCCSMKEARWVLCDTANWNSIFNGPGTGTIEKTPNVAFITGFERGVQHTLKGLDAASYCGFIRGY